MLKILGKIPEVIAVACSGGPDSMAALNFLHNGGKRKIVALYFNHGTEHGEQAENFVSEYCFKNGIEFVVGHISREKDPKESPEEFWRNERYSFFNSTMKWLSLSYGMDIKMVTCHHLDDSVENWIFTALNGEPRLIPHSRDYIVRPFLLTRKSEMIDWCNRKGVPYLIDPSNLDVRYARNRIRNLIIPQVEMINPGIYKVVKKKIIESYGATND
jgi:tRNA(Ile)-lysidine synthase